MVFNEVLEKAQRPSFSNDAGKATDEILLQLRNASSPISFKEAGSVTEGNSLQSLKAASPMTSSFEGQLMSVSLSHCKNIWSPICVMSSDRVTLVTGVW